MLDRISVLIVDDSEQVRSSIKAMLDLEDGFFVVGEVGEGPAAVEMARALRPDVILMDINMPGMDGIAATAAVMQESPTGIVIISVQGEAEYLRRAMQAGARDYLIKPFTADELCGAIRRAAEAPVPAAAQKREQDAPPVEGKLITLFSTKGGVGKTVLAANLATQLAIKTRLKVCAVDLDLEFGVLASLFGTKPAASWLDLARVDGSLSASHVDRVLSRSPRVPVGVLAAPPLPHQAAEVDGEGRRDPRRNYVAEVLDLLRKTYDYVIIDTPCGFRESTLTALDRSDRILVVTVPEVPALQNAAKALDVLLERLEYPRAKVELVLNRCSKDSVLNPAEAEKGLGFKVQHALAEDPQVAWSVSAGQPLTLRRQRSPLTDGIGDLAHHAIGEPQPAGDEPMLVGAGRIQPPAPKPRPKLFGLL